MSLEYTSTTNKSLVIYLALQATNIVVLSFDYYLINNTQTSVTMICTQYPVLGSIAVASQVIAPLSLGLHFLSYMNNDYDDIPLGV